VEVEQSAGSSYRLARDLRTGTSDGGQANANKKSKKRNKKRNKKSKKSKNKASNGTGTDTGGDNGSNDTDNDTATATTATSPEPIDHKRPYFLLAFPTASITSRGSPTQNKDKEEQTLEQTLEQASEQASEQTHTSKHTLTLGKRGRLPLVHGRGHSAWTMNEWVLACGKGEGVLGLEVLEHEGEEGVVRCWE